MMYNVFLFFHLLGFALGFGGALASDSMFFSSIRDKKISKTELRFMKLGSSLVWTGLVLLLLSGLGLFLLDMERLVSSSKFIVKMSIVLIIALNGLVFHVVHMRHIKKFLRKKLNKSKGFKKKSVWVVLSGAVSIISWFAAAILGSLSSVSWSVTELFSIYLLVLSAGCFGAVILNEYLFVRKR